MADGFDVIVVGGGHNGLVTAAYLARSGRRVLVLERRPFVGGAVATEEMAPGFRAATGADVCGPLRPEVVDDLNLTAHGLRLVPLNPEVLALGDRSALRIWRDTARTQTELMGASRKDAEAYPRFVAFLSDFAGALDPLMTSTPPNVANPGLGEQMELVRRALALRRLGKATLQQMLRMPPMPVRDFLNEWFETELLKASLAVDAILGTFQGPFSPGTAFGLVPRFSPATRGNAGSMVQGGIGTLANALALAAREAGVSIRTDTEVKRIRTEDGRAVGVELADGQVLSARVVVSNADPKRTFLHLVESQELNPEFLDRVRNLQMTGVIAKVNVALDGLPTLSATGDGVPAHFRICPSIEYLERAYDDAKYGSASRAPFLEVFVPTIVDPGLAPSGKHVLSALVQYAPYDVRPGNWETEAEPLADRVRGLLEEHMPGFEQIGHSRPPSPP